MKILNENGKLFGKISMVDVLVVVIIVLLIYATIQRYSLFFIPKKDTINQAVQLFNYKTKIENVIPETGEMIKAGDIVYDKSSGTKIGEIQDVTITTAKLDFDTNDGKIKKSNLEGKIDITVIVKSAGIIRDNEYLANNTINILAGETRKFETKYVSVNAEVLDVYKVEG